MSDFLQTPIAPVSLNDQAIDGSIEKALSINAAQYGFPSLSQNGWDGFSAVMFLVGQCQTCVGATEEPCLILNKRSDKVRQPGDLCFPGGGISFRKDRPLSALLRLPKSPLTNWKKRLAGTAFPTFKAGPIALFLAVALREAWEEMRLNPLNVKFLGMLPEQSLIVFDRSIFPMVGWLEHHKTFRTNWEVQRIVRIPIRELLLDGNYGKFQPMVKGTGKSDPQPLHDEQFPCFIHRDIAGKELLWGATFRMVADFLRIVFRYHIPQMDRLPKVDGFLPSEYPEGIPRPSQLS